MRSRGILPLLALLAACNATGKPASGSCRELVAELAAELAALPSACARDADCTCYPGGTDQTGCGGVSSVEASRRIAAKSSAVLSAGCSATLSCAPSRCDVACVEGRCKARPLPAPAKGASP